MTNKEKIAWLGRYKAALRQEKALMEEVAALRADAERVSAGLAGMPCAPGPNIDRLPRAVERINAAQKELASQVERCLDTRAEVLHALATVEYGAGREVLRRRYLLGQTAEQVGAVLCVVPRRVQQMQARALSELKIEEKDS